MPPAFPSFVKDTLLIFLYNACKVLLKSCALPPVLIIACCQAETASVLSLTLCAKNPTLDATVVN